MNGNRMDIDPTIDHYKALGLAAGASAEDIKKAYRKLAKQYHPDSTGGDKAKEQRFKQVSAAYEVLGDTKKREQYDAMRRGGGRGGFPPGFSAGGPQGPGGGFGGGVNIGDLFGQFFVNGQPFGGGGARHVRVDGFDGFAPGRDPSPEPTKIRASDGSLLEVIGSDVYSDVRLSFDEAMLGTVANVATRDGRVEVKVPPGTGSGKKLRLRGKGIPVGGSAGDHYVTIQIDVPTLADDESKRLLAELVKRIKARRAR